MSKEVQVITNPSKRQHYTRDQKVQILAELANSQLSLTRFAKSVGISTPTICMWRKQLKKQKQPASMLPSLTPTSSVDLASEGNLEAANSNLKRKVKDLTDQLYQCYAVIGKKMVQMEVMQNSEEARR